MLGPDAMTLDAILTDSTGNSVRLPLDLPGGPLGPFRYAVIYRERTRKRNARGKRRRHHQRTRREHHHSGDLIAVVDFNVTP